MTLLLETMAAMEMSPHRPIKMSSPSCCNWTGDSGVGFWPEETTCGNALLNTRLLNWWDRGIAERGKKSVIKRVMLMRTRRQKKIAPTAFHISDWKSRRYVIAQGVLSMTAVSIPQQHLTDIRNVSRSQSEKDSFDCLIIQTGTL